AVNEAAVGQYGYTREEFLAMTLEEMHPPEDVRALRDLVAKSETGFRNRGEWRHRKKDGTIIDVEITRNTLTFSGRPAALAMAHDITKRKSVETQLLQAQKMEAVGRLAGGIAHDFNNLLTAIFGSSDLLLEDLTVDDQRRADVEDIKKAAQRAAALTRQLLAFSRKQVLALQVLDLNALIADLEKMLRRLIGEDIEFRTILTSDLGAVRADPGQLEQVIMNLAVNARDAMPQGGKLTLETANVDLDAAYAQAHAPLAPGRYAMLAVSDTGIGIDAQVKAHIFEPFFTTKEKGKGTGLGLATVYGIVKQSDGSIWVYSEPGQGTTFKIYLPRVEAAAEPPAPKPMPPASVRGSETILLAEDEEAVRNLMRRVLEAHGYTLLVAADGQEALRLADGHKGPIHLLLTDIVMPNLGGRQLAERVVSARHATKVLYLSGYTDDAIVHHGVLEPGIAFLEKPFTPQGLARKVRELLDAG
ncbi:MAG: hybrid sensor histidine kinase/response regulator, partial [Gemmatimonadetes bacterium]